MKNYTLLFPIGSVIYRMALCGISFSVITAQNGIWSRWLYFSIVITYILLCILCYAKKFTEIRSVLDFILIDFILFGKEVSNPINYFFLILPLICSVYYTDKIQRMGSILFFTVISLIILAPLKEAITLLNPIVILGCLSYLYEQRRRWMDFSQDLTEEIDSFFCKNEFINSPHKIFKPSINTINKFLKKDSLQDISVYKISKINYVTLISSSVFKWDRSISLTNREIEKLKTSSHLQKYPNKDNQEIFHIYFLIEINKTHYIVRYEFIRFLNLNIYMILGLRNSLHGLAGKMMRVFDLRQRLDEQKSNEFIQFRQRKDYIDKAIDVMHFVRNKLNPMVNILAYAALPDNQKNPQSKQIIKQTIRTAKGNIDDIKVRADQILDPDHYPFKGKIDSVLSVEEVFTILSEIAETHLSTGVKLDGDTPIHDYHFYTNEFELKVLFTDWVSNMEKYGEDQEINFAVIDEHIQISFKNKSKNTGKFEFINVINSLPSKSRNTQKKTHGIYTMKEIADNFKITLSASSKSFKEISNYRLCNVSYG